MTDTLAARALRAHEQHQQQVRETAEQRARELDGQVRNNAAKLIGAIIAQPVDPDLLEVHGSPGTYQVAAVTTTALLGDPGADTDWRAFELAYWPAIGSQPERVKVVAIHDACGEPVAFRSAAMLRRSDDLPAVGAELRALTLALDDDEPDLLTPCSCVPPDPDDHDEPLEPVPGTTAAQVDAFTTAQALLADVLDGDLVDPGTAGILAALVAIAERLHTTSEALGHGPVRVEVLR